MVYWFLHCISKTIWWMCVIFSDNETVWLKHWPQNKYRSTRPIFHVLVILLNLQDYLMDEHHSWFNGSVWDKDWPHQVYIGQLPIFYGPVILPFHRLKLFLYIKKWHRLGVFMTLRAVALGFAAAVNFHVLLLDCHFEKMHFQLYTTSSGWWFTDDLCC